MPKKPAQSHASSRPGAVPVYLISPSSAVPPDAPLDASLARMRAAGFAPVLDPAALRVRQRFAGSDADQRGGLRARGRPARAA
jgi:muramoyltetrapeptide carboxypeptidase LdcA involved in peptidoglycan recycling